MRARGEINEQRDMEELLKAEKANPLEDGGDPDAEDKKGDGKQLNRGNTESLSVSSGLTDSARTLKDSALWDQTKNMRLKSQARLELSQTNGGGDAGNRVAPNLERQGRGDSMSDLPVEKQTPGRGGGRLSKSMMPQNRRESLDQALASQRREENGRGAHRRQSAVKSMRSMTRGLSAKNLSAKISGSSVTKALGSYRLDDVNDREEEQNIRVFVKPASLPEEEIPPKSQAKERNERGFGKSVSMPEEEMPSRNHAKERNKRGFSKSMSMNSRGLPSRGHRPGGKRPISQSMAVPGSLNIQNPVVGSDMSALSALTPVEEGLAVQDEEVSKGHPPTEKKERRHLSQSMTSAPKSGEKKARQHASSVVSDRSGMNALDAIEESLAQQDRMALRRSNLAAEVASRYKPTSGAGGLRKSPKNASHGASLKRSVRRGDQGSHGLRKSTQSHASPKGDLRKSARSQSAGRGGRDNLGKSDQSLGKSARSQSSGRGGGDDLRRSDQSRSSAKHGGRDERERAPEKRPRSQTRGGGRNGAALAKSESDAQIKKVNRHRPGANGRSAMIV